MDMVTSVQKKRSKSVRNQLSSNPRNHEVSFLLHSIGWRSYKGLSRFKGREHTLCLSVEDHLRHDERKGCGMDYILMQPSLESAIWHPATNDPIPQVSPPPSRLCLAYNFYNDWLLNWISWKFFQGFSLKLPSSKHLKIKQGKR